MDSALRGVLERWQAGETGVREQLTPTIYSELRALARHYMRRERRGHTLEPTALVNEACVRILGSKPEVADRAHFVALAARTMRQVLVDHARGQRAAKRFSPEDRVELDTGLVSSRGDSVDVLALDEALSKLAKVAPRAAELVEIRFFGGLENREVAEVLGVSLSTIERDWRAARAWLRDALR